MLKKAKTQVEKQVNKKIELIQEVLQLLQNAEFSD
jgi:hypothetical protein